MAFPGVEISTFLHRHQIRNSRPLWEVFGFSAQYASVVEGVMKGLLTPRTNFDRFALSEDAYAGIALPVKVIENQLPSGVLADGFLLELLTDANQPHQAAIAVRPMNQAYNGQNYSGKIFFSIPLASASPDLLDLASAMKQAVQTLVAQELGPRIMMQAGESGWEYVYPAFMRNALHEAYHQPQSIAGGRFFPSTEWRLAQDINKKIPLDPNNPQYLLPVVLQRIDKHKFLKGLWNHAQHAGEGFDADFFQARRWVGPDTVERKPGVEINHYVQREGQITAVPSLDEHGVAQGSLKHSVKVTHGEALVYEHAYSPVDKRVLEQINYIRSFDPDEPIAIGVRQVQVPAGNGGETITQEKILTVEPLQCRQLQSLYELPLSAKAAGQDNHAKFEKIFRINVNLLEGPSSSKPYRGQVVALTPGAVILESRAGVIQAHPAQLWPDFSKLNDYVKNGTWVEVEYQGPGQTAEVKEVQTNVLDKMKRRSSQANANANGEVKENSKYRRPGNLRFDPTILDRADTTLAMLSQWRLPAPEVRLLDTPGHLVQVSAYTPTGVPDVGRSETLAEGDYILRGGYHNFFDNIYDPTVISPGSDSPTQQDSASSSLSLQSPADTTSLSQDSSPPSPASEGSLSAHDNFVVDHYVQDGSGIYRPSLPNPQDIASSSSRLQPTTPLPQGAARSRSPSPPLSQRGSPYLGR